MTVGGDFIPTEDRSESPNYPKLFGVRLTPMVSGTIIALVGAGFAGWLFFNVVQPVLQQNAELSQDISSKEQQLLNQQDTRKQIADAKNRQAEAEQLQTDVLSLFASSKNLDTLLLDVNERVQAVNAGVQDPKRRAVLSKFALNPTLSGTVTDDSLGSAVNGKLKRQVYDVEIQGTFPQTQSIIRNIERLQPLLVVSNLKSELDQASQKIVLDNQGKPVPTGQPEAKVKTSFQLAALIPTQSDTSAQSGQKATP